MLSKDIVKFYVSKQNTRISLNHVAPRVGPGTPCPALFPSLVHSLPHLLLFFTFSFSCLLYLFSLFPIFSLSTRIVATPFLGRRSYEAIEPGFSLFRSFCVTCVV